jgi:hypothetical protein
VTLDLVYGNVAGLSIDACQKWWVPNPIVYQVVVGFLQFYKEDNGHYLFGERFVEEPYRKQ